MIEHFIQSFGDITVGQAVIVISAIVFLVMVYKKVTSYISKKRQQSVDIQEKFNTMFSNLDKKIDKLQCSSDQGMAYTWRYRILRFNDEILHGQKHSKEHFDQILEDVQNYENYCIENPKFPNNKAVFAIRNIKNVYQKCTDEGSFL